MPNTGTAGSGSLIAQLTTDVTALVRRNTLEDVVATLQGGANGAVRRGPRRPRGSVRDPARSLVEPSGEMPESSR